MSKAKTGRGKDLVPNEKNIRFRYKADKKTVRAYEVRYRDPLGNMRGRCFKTLDAARDWQKRNAVEVMDGKFIAPERSSTPWKQVADEWIAARSVNLRARTLSGYENVLSNWLADWDARAIGEITTDDVRGVIQRLRGKGRKVGTEHHVFDTISGVLKYAVRNKYIRENPADPVREDLRGVADKDFVGTALTIDQAMSIIDVLPAGRFHLYGLLGLWTGFRAGELAGLRVRNVDAARNVIQVEETIEDVGGVLRPGTTKTKKSKGRRVPIPEGVMGEVSAHIEASGLGAGDYVFAGPNEMFSHSNFYRRQWRAACKKAGLEGTRFHTLRHTFVSLRAREGVEPHVLMAWAGHSTITVTMNIYTHIYDEDPRDRAVVDRIYEEAKRRAQQPNLRLVEDEAS